MTPAVIAINISILNGDSLVNNGVLDVLQWILFRYQIDIRVYLLHVSVPT